MAMTSSLDLNQLQNIIRGRRAIRRYANRPISHKLINSIIDAAMWAPSAHNRQPWRVAIVTKPADKAYLALKMGAKLRTDRQADGDPIDDIENDVARSYSRITGAAVLLVMCTSMADMDVYPDHYRSTAEYIMATQSVAMAAQNIWLQAHAAGLGACWLCAPLFVPDLVRDALKLPSDWEPQGMMTLGWPAQTRTKTRAEWQSKVIRI